MISCHQATSKQKELLSSFLKALLIMIKCDSHYRVDSIGNNILIRESTQNPPILGKKSIFNTVIKLLNKVGLFKSNSVKLKAFNIIASIPAIEISNINVDLIDSLIKKNAVNKPDAIDERIWAILSTEIKARWDRFSDRMQNHIIQCTAENLEVKFNALVTTQLLGDTFRSPIGLSIPKIPVRLPNPNLSGGESREVYDLLEILAIAERDPQNPARRRNPTTREYFSLNEVIPAPDAVKALKDRAEEKRDNSPRRR